MLDPTSPVELQVIFVGDIITRENPAAVIAECSFYELYELLHFCKLGTLIGWRRKRRVGAVDGGKSGAARRMSSAPGGNCLKAGWDDTVLNPQDKSSRLPWDWNEQLVVVQERNAEAVVSTHRQVYSA